MNTEEKEISNVEWGLIIGALFTIDLIQIGLEWLLGWLGIGEIINIFLDWMVAMSLALYLQVNGQSITNPKRLFSMLSVTLIEMVPLVQELPLWGLEGIYLMVLSKEKKIINKVTGIVTGSNSNSNDTNKPQ